MSSSAVIIDNITTTDVNSNRIRILIKNRHLFPLEEPNVRNVYELTFRCCDNNYSVTYTIGAWDGRSRSGVLSLGVELYQKLNVVEGSRVLITRDAGGVYSIKRL